MTRIEYNFGWEFFDQITEWIGTNTDPEDVFDEPKLKDWAEREGYIHESEIEEQ